MNSYRFNIYDLISNNILNLEQRLSDIEKKYKILTSLYNVKSFEYKAAEEKLEAVETELTRFIMVNDLSRDDAILVKFYMYSLRELREAMILEAFTLFGDSFNNVYYSIDVVSHNNKIDIIDLVFDNPNILEISHWLCRKFCQCENRDCISSGKENYYNLKSSISCKRLKFTIKDVEPLIYEVIACIEVISENL